MSVTKHSSADSSEQLQEAIIIALWMNTVIKNNDNVTTG